MEVVTYCLRRNGGGLCCSATIGSIPPADTTYAHAQVFGGVGNSVVSTTGEPLMIFRATQELPKIGPPFRLKQITTSCYDADALAPDYNLAGWVYPTLVGKSKGGGWTKHLVTVALASQ